MHWGPREIGVLVGQILAIVLAGWHVNRSNTLKLLSHLDRIDEKISNLANRVLQVEGTLRTYEIDQSSMRDRVSRGESRIDMLYLTSPSLSRDPFQTPEEDKRTRTAKGIHGRRRTDYPPARDGEDDD